MQDGETLLACQPGEARIVRNERIRVVTDRQCCGEVNRVEASDSRVDERCGSYQYGIVNPDEHQSIEYGVSPFVHRPRLTCATKGAVYFNPRECCADAIRPAIQSLDESSGLRLQDDELYNRRAFEIHREKVHNRSSRSDTSDSETLLVGRPLARGTVDKSCLGAAARPEAISLSTADEWWGSGINNATGRPRSVTRNTVPVFSRSR